MPAVEARGAAGDHLGSLWNEMMNCGGLDQGTNDGCSEKGSDSGYILKVEPIEFADRLVVGGKRKRGIKDDSKVFS